MKQNLLLTLITFTSYTHNFSSIQFEKRVAHLINSLLTAENKNVRLVTDPVITFSAGGIGTMDNLSTTTSIVNSGTLSVAGTSTLGTINISSLSNSGNETVGGTLSVSGVSTLGTINASSLSLSGNETVTGNLSVTGTLSQTNLNFVDSTAIAGNITKGNVRFITNYGTNNTFVGKGAANFTLTTANAIQNTALGALALSGLVGTAATNATSNTAIGYNAAPSMTDGSNNTALGQGALPSVTTGSSNIAIGSGAGATLTSGSSNIYIGASAASTTESSTVRIGTTGTGLNTTIAGAIFIPDTPTGVGLTLNISGNQVVKLLSSRKFKKNIEPLTDVHTHKLLQLQPVSFNFITDPCNTIQYGLIAEDVNDIMPELVVLDENNEPYSIAYQNLYALLLKAIQEQQIILDNQSRDITSLHEEIDILKTKENSQTKDNTKKYDPLISALQNTVKELLICIIALEGQSNNRRDNYESF